MSAFDDARQLTRETLAVFAKEAKSEWRTRTALSATVLFALGALLLMLTALQGRPPVALSREGRISVATALLWLLLYFTATTGLARAFVSEEERGTGILLRLVARPEAVWLGKFAANTCLLLGLALVITPLLLSGLDTGANANIALLILVIGLGSIGMAATLTTASALVAQSTARSGLLSVLSLPLLMPLLVAVVHGTRAALGIGTSVGQMPAFALGTGDLQVLLSYASVSVAASLLLFGFVWDD